MASSPQVLGKGGSVVSLPGGGSLPGGVSPPGSIDGHLARLPHSLFATSAWGKGDLWCLFLVGALVLVLETVTSPGFPVASLLHVPGERGISGLSSSSSKDHTSTLSTSLTLSCCS